MRARLDITEPEVLTLLSAGGALQGPLFASLIERLMRAPVELPQGERVGPFRVVETLGHGGMAVVYLAERDDGEFQQRVALKLVVPGDGLDVERERELLRRERQILAGLEHPHIARLLDGGTTPDGALWFAMELVEGERIDRWCEAQAADRRARLALFLQVCDAVQFAHARLLVHRDLKPSNILVTAAGAVKLLDFGIAAIAQPGQEHATPRALTPGWASPEQRRGEAATTASDIWQLGRLLETIGNPSTRRADTDLAAIVAKARHEQVFARYATVGELAGDLRALLEGRPVAAREGGAAYRLGRFVARHRFASGAALFASLLILALAATFAARLAQERDAAAREAASANATAGFLVDLFRANDPAASRGRSVDARELLRRGEARLEALDAQPEVKARLLLAIARIHDSLGDPAHARELLDRALASARDAPQRAETLLAEAALSRVEVVLHMGQPMEALRLLDEAEPLVVALPGDARRTRLRMEATRAMAQLGRGDLASASASARAALGLAIELDGIDSATAAERYNDLGIVLRAQGEQRGAADAFGNAHRRWLDVHGADHPRTIHAQKNIATALLELGEIERAGPMLIDAIERHRVLFGGRGAEYGAALRTLARLSTLRGEHRAALSQLDASLATIEEAVEPGSTAIAFTLQARAAAHATLDDPQAALRDYRRALAIRRERLPAGHLDIAGSLAGAAVQQWRIGDYAAAERDAWEAFELRRAKRGAHDAGALRALVLVGLAREARGDRTGAAQAFAQARAAVADEAARQELERWIDAPATHFRAGA